MQPTKDDLLRTVEVGTLAMGSAAVALPRASARIGGADPAAGANAASTRALGFWLTTYGALLQFAERDDERDRLLTAGAACGSAYCVNALVAAARRRITWRGALTQVVLGGTVVAAACRYLAD